MGETVVTRKFMIAFGIFGIAVWVFFFATRIAEWRLLSAIEAKGYYITIDGERVVGTVQRKEYPPLPERAQ
jgi:hypothetical protein